MARTALTVQDIVKTGLSPSYTAANADGHSVANVGDMLVHVKNGGAGSITVTCQTPAKQDGMDIAELQVAIPAGEERMIGSFPTRTFNQSDGTVYVDFSGVSSVTVAALRL